MKDNILEQYYEALASDNSSKLKEIHIPRSDVFYVKTAIEARTGEQYSLDRIERAMYLEGFLKRKDVLDPDRKRDWE